MNRALFLLVPLLWSFFWSFFWPVASMAQAGGSYFDVRCTYTSTGEPAPSSCKAELQLCSSASPADCRDQGKVACESSEESTVFNGLFVRSQVGTTIHLQAETTLEAQVPHLTLGPAKNPPRPGRPVVSDSHLEFGTHVTDGECTVRLIR